MVYQMRRRKLIAMDTVGTIRKVTKPLKIATGEVLPVGVICGVDTHYNHFSRSNLEDPEVFDGFR